MPCNSAPSLVVCSIFRVVPSSPQLLSEHLPHPKRKSLLFGSYFPSNCPLDHTQHPRQRLIFLSLPICLFSTFHVTGIIQYVTFVSVFFHLLCFQGSSMGSITITFLHVIAKYCSTYCSSIHHLVDIWVIYPF